MAIDRQQVSCLCSLDISVAFNPIDHTIFTNHLSSLFGIVLIALWCINKYLLSCSFNVSAAGQSSYPRTIICNVPKSSLLDPFLFIIHTSTLWPVIFESSLIKKTNLCRPQHPAISHLPYAHSRPPSYYRQYLITRSQAQ